VKKAASDLSFFISKVKAALALFRGVFRETQSKVYKCKNARERVSWWF
jgi:hypothetical protein